MFKSLSIKIAMMFVLLTISIIILIGSFMTGSIDTFYDNEFKNLMSLVFSDEYEASLIRALTQAWKPKNSTKTSAYTAVR